MWCLKGEWIRRVRMSIRSFLPLRLPRRWTSTVCFIIISTSGVIVVMPCTVARCFSRSSSGKPIFE